MEQRTARRQQLPVNLLERRLIKRIRCGEGNPGNISLAAMLHGVQKHTLQTVSGRWLN